ncbi:MAG: Hsp20/alpha crystallin family protein [Candidatus Bathyarchaeales archaeon]
MRADSDMKWRRSEKRPKWFKIVKKLDEAENEKASKISRTKNLKVRGRPHPYMYRNSKSLKKTVWKEPEPLLDIFQEKDNVVVVAELKGFKRENIKAHAEKQRLILSAKAQERKYYKSLNLPKGVIPESMRITYKNGVLEIRLKKALEEKALNKVAG